MIDITHRILHDQQFTPWYGGFFKMRYPNSSLDDENIGQSQTKKWMKTGGKAFFQETSIRQLQLLNISPFFSYVKPYWQSVSISMGLWAILPQETPIYLSLISHLHGSRNCQLFCWIWHMINPWGASSPWRNGNQIGNLHSWWIPWKLSQLYHHNYSIYDYIWL